MTCPRCTKLREDGWFLCLACRSELKPFVAALWLENPKLAQELEERFPKKPLDGKGVAADIPGVSAKVGASGVSVAVVQPAAGSPGRDQETIPCPAPETRAVAEEDEW